MCACGTAWEGGGGNKRGECVCLSECTSASWTSSSTEDKLIRSGRLRARGEDGGLEEEEDVYLQNDTAVTLPGLLSVSLTWETKQTTWLLSSASHNV